MLADYVVPVGGRHTPPRNQTQRQRRQQSQVVVGAADMAVGQEDRHDQVPPVVLAVLQGDIPQLDNLDVVDLPEVDKT